MVEPTPQTVDEWVSGYIGAEKPMGGVGKRNGVGRVVVVIVLLDRPLYLFGA